MEKKQWENAEIKETHRPLVGQMTTEDSPELAAGLDIQKHETCTDEKCEYTE